MSRPAFDALDRDWATLPRTAAAADALARWGVPALAATDLEALVVRIWASPKAEADRACAELAGRAPCDWIAARVLLQVLRPGLRNLGRRLALGGSFDDVDQDLLAIAWERIRTYRIDHRPASVAANILLDVRKRYLHAVVGHKEQFVSLDDLPASRWPSAPSAEHEALEAHGPSLRRAHARLLAAVEAGAITPLSARVVWRTRVQEDDDAAVACEFGVGVRTLSSAAGSAPSASSQQRVSRCRGRRVGVGRYEELAVASIDHLGTHGWVWARRWRQGNGVAPSGLPPANEVGGSLQASGRAGSQST